MSFGNVAALISDSPDAERQFLAMSSAIEMNGAEPIDRRIFSVNDNFVGLCQSTVATSREAPHSPLPGIHVVADVRLDNRRELINLLAEGAGDPSDEFLIGAAYQRWGTDCARHLRGDFAFIVWDPGLRRLLAARDMFGVRTLLYATDGDRTLVGSTIGGLLAGMRHRPRVDIEYLRQFVRARFAGPLGPTAFESIRWVPAGHQLEVGNSRVQVVRYDSLQPKTIPAGTDVLAEFRSHLTTAVERRLRANGPVGLMVSGGFDSSAIACLANQAAEQGRCEVPLRAYSSTFERYPDGDERVYLRATMQRCRHVTATEVPSDDVLWSVDSLLDDDGFPMDEPAPAPRILGATLSQMARRDGCRVMLRGTWADQLLIRSAYSSPQLLWDLPLRLAWREWHHFRTRTGIKPLAYGAFLGWSRQLAQAKAQIGLGAKPATAAQAMITARVVSARDHVVLDFENRLARWTGAEIRFPYLDRDLFEFVLGLDAEWLFADGLNKRPLREGLADLLPPSFRTRTMFASMSHVLVEGMKRERTQIAKQLRSTTLVDAGVLSVAERQRLLDCLDSDRHLLAYAMRIQRAVATIAWLKRQSGEPAK